MARAVWLLLLGSVLMAVASGQTTECFEIEQCWEKFHVHVVNIGHDRGTFCREHRSLITCYQGVINKCAIGLRGYAQGKIASAQREEQKACDSCVHRMSLSLLAAVTSLAILWGRGPT